MEAQKAREHSKGDADARERIAAVAEALFAERGYAGTSMQAIADGAKVNKAMLYYYFKDKRDLYRSIIQTGLDALSSILDEIGADASSAREKVADFARRSYMVFASKRSVVRILYREVMGLGEKIDLPLGKYILKNFAKLEGIIREGIRHGEFRSVDPRLAARSLLGVLNLFITEPFVTGEAFPPNRVVKHTVELFCRGIDK